MITKVISVDVDESGDYPNLTYVVSKTVREQAETLGEKVNEIPQKLEVYNGTDRLAAQQAADDARREMFA